MIHFQSKTQFKSDATLIFLTQEQSRKPAKMDWPAGLKKVFNDSVSSVGFSGEAGEIVPAVYQSTAVLFVGLGAEKELSATSLRRITRRALLSSWVKKKKTVECVPHEDKEETVTALIEGFLIGTYEWKKYKGRSASGAKTAGPRSLGVVARKQRVYAEVAAICEGVNCARDLVNDNADVVTSAWFEKTIRQLTRGHRHVRLEILNREQLKKKGLHLHLAVNQGSDKEPKLILVHYRGGKGRGVDAALVGKGMTFDTGGLNLKPSGSIETMRCDMSGAAAVVGTLKNALALKIPKNVIFAVGLAENAIGPKAYKPGDVFRSYSGKTVEIGNTDAEGRLVLADAIAYIVRNYKPKGIVDIATLTGACVVALGYDYSGLVASDDRLARLLEEQAARTDDRVWRLPSYPEIKDYVRSQIADIRNLGLPRGAAGTLTAAEFLRQFTEGVPWAHLDIAGTAFNEKRERFYFGYGATGAGVRLLTRFLQAV